jgi:Tol biopolymer transport system component
MTVTTPPPRPDVRSPIEPEALIEEARRRASRRRRRNVAGAIAVLLGALWLYSTVGSGGPGPGDVALSSPARAAPTRAGLPEELSFYADDAVWLIGRDGSRRRFVDGVWGVDWSPDGSKLLAFRQGHSPALVLVDASGKIQGEIARGASIGRWSPDGGRVAFVRGETGGGSAIFVVSSDGEDVVRVAPLAQHSSGSFSWSPDGTRLVYARRRAAGLFVVDADGNGAPRRTWARSGVAEAQWSPDGSSIAFRSRGGVYVVRPDGTDGRRIVDGHVAGLAWSPDSRWIAFLGPSGPGSFGNVSVVRRDGSGLHVVGRCPCVRRGPGFSASVSWSSDGSRLAYVGGDGEQISTVRPDGSGTARVATQTGPWWPLWRPARR